MPSPIGILGGTFDPIHNGHLHLATTVLEQLKLSELRFIPLNIPAHRHTPLATTQQRLAMLQLATADHAKLKVDDCEIQRGGISYTIDTLRSLRHQLPQTPLCLILGIDSLNSLNHWKQWRSLLHYSHIVIVNRPHHDQPVENQQLKQFLHRFTVSSAEQLHQQIAGYIIKFAQLMLDVSSTQIRKDLLANKKKDILLSTKVLEFADTHHLYKGTCTLPN